MSIRIEETYYPNSILKFRCYYNDANQFHREDGPAYETYYSNGELQHSVWFLHGQIHREDGPAYEGFDLNGILIHREWWIEGNLHRENGPAQESFISRGPDQITNAAYYLKGVHIAEAEYPRHISLLKLTTKNPAVKPHLTL